MYQIRIYESAKETKLQTHMSSGIIAALVAIIFCAGCSRPSVTVDPVFPSGTYAFTGATIVNSRGAVHAGSTLVWIDADRITYAGMLDDVVLPDSVERIDLTGKWITPGLMDLHIHAPHRSNQAHDMQTMLAFGITTVRVAAATSASGLQLKADVESGLILGPNVITAGRLLDSPGSVHSHAEEVVTSADTRRAVRSQVNEGVDYVKLYIGLPDSLVAAAIDEAHLNGLKVLGHLGQTTWLEASKHGIDGLTHSGLAGPVWELVPPPLLPDNIFNTDHGDPAELLRYFLDVFDADGGELDTLSMSLLQHGVEVNPNLVLTWAMLFGSDADKIRRFEPDFANRDDRESWTDKPNPYSQILDSPSAEFSDSLYAAFTDIVLALADKGVLVTTGTDLGNPWMTPGVALHEELLLLQEAGLSVNQVIAAATSNGAAAMGLSRVGQIRSGYQANFLILNANPLDDIRNLKEILYVVTSGTAYQPDDLLKD